MWKGAETPVALKLFHTQPSSTFKPRQDRSGHTMAICISISFCPSLPSDTALGTCHWGSVQRQGFCWEPTVGSLLGMCYGPLRSLFAAYTKGCFRSYLPLSGDWGGEWGPGCDLTTSPLSILHPSPSQPKGANRTLLQILSNSLSCLGPSPMVWRWQTEIIVLHLIWENPWFVSSYLDFWLTKLRKSYLR